MRLEGIHHITAITGDAPRNVDFYTRVLGLRLVKKSVNQDDPTVYHLFYADEKGSAGSDLTFFEYPGAQRGRAGRGMVHRIGWRVASEDALSFWAERLARRGRGGRPPARRRAARSPTPRGCVQELVVDASGDDPLIAEHPEIPAEHALRGFDGVRAYASDPEQSRALLETALDFAPGADGWEVRGASRGSHLRLRRAARGAGHPGRRDGAPRRVGARCPTSRPIGASGCCARAPARRR